MFIYVAALMLSSLDHHPLLSVRRSLRRRESEFEISKNVVRYCTMAIHACHSSRQFLSRRGRLLHSSSDNNIH